MRIGNEKNKKYQSCFSYRPLGTLELCLVLCLAPVLLPVLIPLVRTAGLRSGGALAWLDWGAHARVIVPWRGVVLGAPSEVGLEARLDDRALTDSAIRRLACLCLLLLVGLVGGVHLRERVGWFCFW